MASAPYEGKDFPFGETSKSKMSATKPPVLVRMSERRMLFFDFWPKTPDFGPSVL